MPTAFIISPASIKKGIAKNGKRSSQAKIRDGEMARNDVPPSEINPTTPAAPMTKPIGIPIKISPTKTTATIMSNLLLFWAYLHAIPDRAAVSEALD